MVPSRLLVSVIINNYNYGRFLEFAIESADIAESIAGNTKLQEPNITKGTGYHANGAGVTGLERVIGSKPILVTDMHYTLTGSGNFLTFIRTGASCGITQRRVL